MNRVLDRLADGAMSAAALAALAFVLLYWRGSDWRATVAGRALMRVAAALALVLAQGSFSAWSGYQYPGRELVRLALYCLLATSLAGLVRTMRRSQRASQQSEA